MKSFKTLGKKLSQARLGRKRNQQPPSPSDSTSSSDEFERRLFSDSKPRKAFLPPSKYQLTDRLPKTDTDDTIFYILSRDKFITARRAVMCSSVAESECDMSYFKSFDVEESMFTCSFTGSASLTFPVTPPPPSLTVTSVCFPTENAQPKMDEVNHPTSASTSSQGFDIKHDPLKTERVCSLNSSEAASDSDSDPDKPNVAKPNPAAASSPLPYSPPLECLLPIKPSPCQQGGDRNSEATNSALPLSESVLTDLGVPFGCFPPPPTRDLSDSRPFSNPNLESSPETDVFGATPDTCGSLSCFADSMNGKLARPPSDRVKINMCINTAESAIRNRLKQRTRLVSPMPTCNELVLPNDLDLAETADRPMQTQVDQPARLPRSRSEQSPRTSQDSQRSWPSSEEDQDLSLEVVSADRWNSKPLSDGNRDLSSNCLFSKVAGSPASKRSSSWARRHARSGTTTPTARRLSGLGYLRDGLPIPERVPRSTTTTTREPIVAPPNGLQSVQSVTMQPTTSLPLLDPLLPP